jgi:hypothetical protein
MLTFDPIMVAALTECLSFQEKKCFFDEVKKKDCYHPDENAIVQSDECCHPVRCYGECYDTAR